MLRYKLYRAGGIRHIINNISTIRIIPQNLLVSFFNVLLLRIINLNIVMIVKGTITVIKSII